MPPVDQHRALVAWSPVGKGQTQIFGVDLIKGWKHAQLALHVRAARKDNPAWLVDVPKDGPEVALHLVSQAAGQEDLKQLWDQYHPRGLWTAEVNIAAAKRWEEINSQPQ